MIRTLDGDDDVKRVEEEGGVSPRSRQDDIYGHLLSKQKWKISYRVTSSFLYVGSLGSVPNILDKLNVNLGWSRHKWARKSVLIPDQIKICIAAASALESCEIKSYPFRWLYQRLLYVGKVALGVCLSLVRFTVLNIVFRT